MTRCVSWHLLTLLAAANKIRCFQGASPRELVVEACRRDQPHLIEQVLHDMENQSNEDVAKFFNEVTDSMGNHALHICASYGSCMSTPRPV